LTKNRDFWIAVLVVVALLWMLNYGGRMGRVEIASKRSWRFAPRLDRWEPILPWAFFHSILIDVRFKRFLHLAHDVVS
jgi:hypothetical protein